MDIGALAKQLLKELPGYALAQGPSRFAKTLRADLEFACPGTGLSETCIAILAPSLVNSTRQSSIDDVCAAMMAGTLVFKRVFFVVGDEAEWKDARLVLSQTRIDFARVTKLRVRGGV